MHKINRAVLLLLVFLVPYAVSAEKLGSYNTDFKVIDKYVLSTVEYNFISSSNKDLMVVLPADAWNLSLNIDGEELAPNITGNKIKIPIKESTKKVKLIFYTKDLLNYNSPTGIFFTEIIAPFDSESVKSTLTLPTGSASIKLINETSARPTRTETNGQETKLIWEEHDVPKNFKMSNLAVFDTERQPAMIISSWKITMLLFSLFAVIIAQVAYLIVYRNNKIKQIEKNLSKKFSIDGHLKEEESQIINVLRLKEGQTSQGTLGVVTGMPKATLSKLLSELEARNVIQKEKSGKKNIVSLKEHFRNNNNGGAVL